MTKLLPSNFELDRYGLHCCDGDCINGKVVKIKK